jgi:hypothetical protein
MIRARSKRQPRRRLPIGTPERRTLLPAGGAPFGGTDGYTTAATTDGGRPAGTDAAAGAN